MTLDMERTAIILAVALAFAVFFWILAEIGLRQQIKEWAKVVAENCRLKEKLKKYEQEGKNDT